MDVLWCCWIALCCVSLVNSYYLLDGIVYGLIPGGKKRDTQMVSNGSFWNTKGQCLHHRTTLFLAMSNFTMMVRLYLLQDYSIYTSVCGFTLEPGDGMLVVNKTCIF